jgi:hypothetical protein
MLVVHVSCFLMFDFASCTALLTPAEVITTLNSAAFEQWNGVLDNHGRAVVRGFRGLTWSIHPEKGRLRISGSIPTFANGQNVQLLPFPEAALATAALAAAVGLPAERLVVKGLELSADIDLPTSPRPFLESLVHHRQSNFCAVTPPKGVARPLEYNAPHGNYRVKYYDKGAWAAHQGSPLPPGQYKLRYEVVCTRARPINALLNQAQITLADLATPGFYLAAAAELRKHWQLTVRRTPPNFTGLKWKDSALLQSGASPEFWRGLKEAKTPLVTIKRQKARYKQLAAAAQERAGVDIYNQRFPLVLDAALATVPAVENDTILHSCNQVEFPPLKEIEEAHPFPTAEGLLLAESALSPLPDKDRVSEREEEMVVVVSERKVMREEEQVVVVSEREVVREQEEKREEKFATETPTPSAQRCCQTCGRLLNSRNAMARFCSEKELGKAAKKCRNAASNPRNNARRCLLKIESQAQLFDTRPYVKVPEQIREFVLAS